MSFGGEADVSVNIDVEDRRGRRRMLKRVRWPAEDCFCTGLMVITSSLSLPAVGGKKWSTIWCSLIGIEWRKISSRLRMRPSFTRRPSLVTGIHSSLSSPPRL